MPDYAAMPSLHYPKKLVALMRWYGSLQLVTVPYHPPVKRSIAIDGHKTSISLEPLFWEMLKGAARHEAVPVSALVARIDAERIKSPTPPGLASAIRVWLVSQPGHEA